MRPTAVMRRVRSAAACRRLPSTAGLAGLLLLSALPLLTGCESLGSVGAPAGTVRDNVVMIRQFYAADPWIRDEEGRVTGVLARVYFAAAARDDEVPKGIFVPGTIKAELYILTLRPDGSNERVLIHEWKFDEQQAQGYRVRRVSRMGCSYGLILRWPPEVNVMGREIQMQFSYQTQAAKVVTQRGSRFRVPLPAGRADPSETGTGRNQPATRPHAKPGTE
jgi:hypothetical protein